MKFGERLRELRRQRGISQRDFAEMVEVDFTYISKIETGDTPPPGRVTIHHIAQVLGADETELMLLADKVPLETYKELLQRAYNLLDDSSDPFRPVGKDEMRKWLEDARPYMEDAS